MIMHIIIPNARIIIVLVHSVGDHDRRPLDHNKYLNMINSKNNQRCLLGQHPAVETFLLNYKKNNLRNIKWLSKGLYRYTNMKH